MNATKMNTTIAAKMRSPTHGEADGTNVNLKAMGW